MTVEQWIFANFIGAVLGLATGAVLVLRSDEDPITKWLRVLRRLLGKGDVL